MRKLGSAKLKLNSTDLPGIIKTITYAGSSAIIVSIIALLPQVDVPEKWIWLVPLINTFLVVANKFFKDNSQKNLNDPIYED